MLFPALTGLLHQSTPAWLRPHVSTSLSLLPLRAGGVRETIYFIARSAPENSQQSGNPQDKNQGPTLSLDIAEHASRLLSAVPKSMSAQHYFSKIAPQLLELLDTDDSDLQWLGSHIIGSGILGKRSLGAPGTIGWELFAGPILNVIAPVATSPQEDDEIVDLRSTIMDAKTLLQAIKRLWTLVSKHPNPGIVQRLLKPLFLPLWAILCESKGSEPASNLTKMCSHLLTIYLQTSASYTQLLSLIPQLFWCGQNHYMYLLNAEEGVKICRCKNLCPLLTYDPYSLDGATGENTKTRRRIDIRKSTFMQLIDDLADDTQVMDLTMQITEHLLLGKQWSFGATHEVVEDPKTRYILREAQMQLAYSVLMKHQSILLADPQKILALLLAVLRGGLSHVIDTAPASKEWWLTRARFADLSGQQGPEGEEKLDHERLEELMAVSISLLVSIISAPDFNPLGESEVLLGKLADVLATIRDLPSGVFKKEEERGHEVFLAVEGIKRVRSQCSKVENGPDEEQTHFQGQEKWFQARTDLASDLPPIRGKGLLEINRMITEGKIINVSTTGALLISLLSDDDEYVHLGAIQNLGLLAQQYHHIILKQLLDTYADAGEVFDLDVRLRVGEATAKIIEALNTAFTGSSAAHVVETLINLAGRRTKRLKKADEALKQSAAQQHQQAEAEDAWGGEVPQLDEPDSATERLAHILRAWHGRGTDEDIRIRTSALSVLGVALETNLPALDPALVASALDLALAVVRLEQQPEDAILRRAAVLLVLGLVRALDAARAAHRPLAYELAGQSLAEVADVLARTAETDADDLVRGHAGEVLEAIETWKANAVLDLVGGGENVEPVLELETLKGLDVQLDELSTAKRQRIEEID